MAFNRTQNLFETGQIYKSKPASIKNFYKEKEFKPPKDTLYTFTTNIKMEANGKRQLTDVRTLRVCPHSPFLTAHLKYVYENVFKCLINNINKDGLNTVPCFSLLLSPAAHGRLQTFFHTVPHFTTISTSVTRGKRKNLASCVKSLSSLTQITHHCRI